MLIIATITEGELKIAIDKINMHVIVFLPEYLASISNSASATVLALRETDGQRHNEILLIDFTKLIAISNFG